MLPNTDIIHLPGLGEKKTKVIKKALNIHTVWDLLCYYPYKYVDRSKIYSLSEVKSGITHLQTKGTIKNIQTIGSGRKTRLSAQLVDGYASIELVWFSGVNYVKNKIQEGKEYLVYGRISVFNGHYSISHPEIKPYTPETLKLCVGQESHYNTSAGMKRMFLNSAGMRNIIYHAWQLTKNEIIETLPQYIISYYKLYSLVEAIRAIHFPKDAFDLEQARYRLKFEELFYNQLIVLKRAKSIKENGVGHLMSKVGTLFMDFYQKHLPFSLTNAQQRVIREIKEDISSGKQMNRLIQGDVGSGKTLVALMVMLLAKDNGFQSCLMAPTEILAQQHFLSISEMMKKIDIKIGLLTGSTTKKQRDVLLENLSLGKIDILIGTHALIEDTVQFNNLGMVIIDEQHRFGVEQRSRLWRKNTVPPHILVMTATPIPRTLAMTIYGDLDVSIIDELPAGRQPIKTEHRVESERDALLRFIKKEADKGRQAYIVYPMIEGNEGDDIQAVEQGYEYVKTHLPSLSVSMIHGKMNPKDKEREMSRFVNGETHILVATTVIEVGVNVPNATVMIIESAQRFGLSQLHQLRGRVGRGGEQSYCFLLTPTKLNYPAERRMNTMVSSNDGFVIAEVDMQLRGSGDIEGTAQSGDCIDFKIADLYKDVELLKIIRNQVQTILDVDCNLLLPDNSILHAEYKKREQSSVRWRDIS
jgi:ATP-dependent DNA helicase RecG